MEFTPQIDPATLADLNQRLDRTRWPASETVQDWSQGVPLHWLQELVDHWRSGYDWNRLERKLTRHPQVKTRVGGLGIHAIHARSSHHDAIPIVLTHGWPSTAFEFNSLIDMLTEPEKGPAFHVVCPSLPGYGFSDKPNEPGWGSDRISDAWGEMMSGLGYGRFLAHGGDWGAFITTQMAIRHPDRVGGIHLTMPLVNRSSVAAEDLTDFERDGLAREADYRHRGFGYAAIQSSKPQTIGYGLEDSPVTLCAWIAEKLHDWSGTDASGAPRIDRDTMLDVVSIYWLTRTGTSSARLYFEALRGDQSTLVTAPAACSIFPDEIIRPPQHVVEERYVNLFSWHKMPRGGHFPALEVPADLAAEIQHFVTTLSESALRRSPSTG